MALGAAIQASGTYRLTHMLYTLVSGSGKGVKKTGLHLGSVYMMLEADCVCSIHLHSAYFADVITSA